MSASIKIINNDISMAFVSGRHVMAFWDEIEEALGVAIEKSHGEVTVEHVRDLLLDHRAFAWVVSDGDRMIGLAVCETLPTAKGNYLNVPFAWGEGSLEVMNRTMDEIEAYAEEHGYHGIKFLSSIGKWQKWAERRGYRMRFVEYVKEVDNG